MSLELISEILLPRLLAASVQSTLFVALVWALCKLLPRLSASVRAGLWWLVALQLVVGVLWSSPLAVPLLPAETLQQVSAAPAPMTMLAATEATTALPVAQAMSSTPVASSWTWTEAFAWMWLLGLSFMLTRTLLGYLSTRRLLRGSQPCKDRALLHALNMAAEAHGLRRVPRLRLSAAIDSPQLVGPWRPVLLLPANHPQSMHADELDMALTHELVHLQRGDLWWGLMPAAAQHLFFFHPLAHLAAHEYALAREVACDAAVLAGNRHCAHDYGRLLIRLGVAPRPNAGLASASPTFQVLKRRLAMLQNTASTPRAAALIIVGVAAILGVMPYRITAAAAPEAPVAPAAPATPIAHLAPAPVAAPAPRVAPTPVAAPQASGLAAWGVAAPAAPEAPPAPPAPPSTADVPAPAAIAEVPAPPAPPAPLTTRGTFTFVTDTDQAYVMLSGDESFAMGSTDDFREARRQRNGKEDLLWVRKGNARYVIRDPATLRKLKSVGDEMNALGQQQGALGAKQGELGAKQGELGARQAAIAAQAAAVAGDRAAQAAARAAVAAHATAAGRAEVAAKARAAESAAHAAAADRQRAMSQQMEVMAKRQEALAHEQAALGARQAVASERASRQASKLVEEAIASGKAQPINQ